MIENLLLSLLKVKDSEIIIIENNSSATEKKKYKKILANYPAIKYFSAKKGELNLPKARWYGIKKSVGEYVFHIDDDDTMTEEMIIWLNNNEPKENIYRFKYLRNKYSMDPSINGKIIKASYFKTVQVSTFLIKKEIIKKEWHWLPQNMREDNIFASFTFKYKQKFIDIHSIKYGLLNKSSMSRKKKSNLFQEEVMKTFDMVALSYSQMKSDVAALMVKRTIGNFGKKWAKKNSYFLKKIVNDIEVKKYYPKFVIKSINWVKKIK